VSLPVLVAIGAGAVILVVLVFGLTLQVADLSARAREADALRRENSELQAQTLRIRELEAEVARIQELETRVRRWAGIDAGARAPSRLPAGSFDWEREEALLAEIPSLAPLSGWVSRGFEARPEGHAGLDLVQETGTPVQSAGFGIVRFAGWDDTYGNLVVLDHGNGFTSLYGHNEALLVREGDLVARGEPIARLGNTGRSSAPHLHFEVRLEDEPLDPAFLVRPNG
jgi:murein DD-endopeptidase MepM/ murein hydrolase activator NlpD